MNNIPKFYIQRELNNSISIRFYERIPDNLNEIIQKELKEKFFNKPKTINKKTLHELECIIIDKLLNLLLQNLLFRDPINNKWCYKKLISNFYYQHICLRIDYETCPCCAERTIDLETGKCRNCGFIRSYPFNESL